MKAENESKKNNCVDEIQRTPDEITARITELIDEIHRNNVWIDTGIISKSQEPVSLRKQRILNGKILELKWMLGEEITITEGLL